LNLRAIPPGLLVVLLVLAAHAGSLKGGFHYDDEAVIVLNRANLEDPSTIAKFVANPGAFSGSPGNPLFRPVAHASHVLDAARGAWGPEGPDPRPFHLTNLALHAAAAWVLWRLLRRILAVLLPPPPEGETLPIPAADAAAFLGAAWFGLHPAHAEVVNYVTARSESLAGLFFLLALWAHHAAHEAGRSPGRRALLVAASLGAALLSFGSKETGILLPAVAAALDLWGRPEGGSAAERIRRAAVRALPFAVAAGAWLLLRRHSLGMATVDLAARAAMEGAGVDPLVGGGRSLVAHLLTQARVVAASGLLLLLPTDLAPDHGVRVGAALDLPTCLALAALGVAAALVVRAARRGDRLLPLMAAWTALAAAPSVLVPLNVLMNEHRLYLPATGLALGAGVILLGVARAAARAGGLLAGGLGILALFCGYIAIDGGRALDWRDPYRLWRRATEASPDSWRNHLHLGVQAYRRAKEGFEALNAAGLGGDPGAMFAERAAREELDFAMEEFHEAHRLYPRAFETRLNLGFAHLHRGLLVNRGSDPDAPADPEPFLEAARWFTLAEESSPNSFRAFYNRATAWAFAGRVGEAIGEFERLSADRSRTTLYAWPLADLYRRAGRTEDALAQLALVEEREPSDAGIVALRRGEVLAAAKRFREADRELQRAASILGPGDPRPPALMARVLVGTGIAENLPAARVLWAAALARGHRPGPRDRAVMEAVK
jgi:tetratricopeptide (TPR) repeat protein